MPDPEKGKTLATLADDDLVEITVDGEKEQITWKDARARIQKRGHAERAMQTQSDLTKEFEADLQVAKNLKDGFVDRNPELMKKAFRGIGATDEQIEALFGGSESAPGGTGSESRNTGDTEGDDDELLGIVETLQAQMKNLTDEREKDRQNAQRELTIRTVSQGVDKHTFLGTIKGKLKSDKAKKALDKRAYLAVVEAMETLPWGPRALSAGLDLLKDELVAEQAALSGDDTPEAAEEKIPVPGFGPGGMPVSRVHQAADKRVSVRDPNYGLSVAARFARRVRGLTKTG